jgi:hypothetical protein
VKMEIQKKSVIFILFLIFIVLTPQLTVPDITDYTTPQIGKEWDTEGRKQYAEKLKSFIDKINDCIPNLSPDQKKMVRQRIT